MNKIYFFRSNKSSHLCMEKVSVSVNRRCKLILISNTELSMSCRQASNSCKTYASTVILLNSSYNCFAADNTDMSLVWKWKRAGLLLVYPCLIEAITISESFNGILFGWLQFNFAIGRLKVRRSYKPPPHFSDTSVWLGTSGIYDCVLCIWYISNKIHFRAWGL